MISMRRRTFAIGRSRGITLPGTMRIGDEVSMAARGDQLLLVDTAGEIPEGKLSEFLERFEPMFWQWWKSQRHPQPVEVEAVAALEVRVFPQPPVYNANCPRCLYSFPWDLDRGSTGFCPSCGAHLWFKP